LAHQLVYPRKQQEDKMKKLILTCVIFLASFSFAEAKTFYGERNIGMFYHSLKPYGEWIYLDDDLIVWRPMTNHAGWRPYSDGRWVWTRHGWYWDSFEPFGWATFHYGRWIFDDYYGWVWLPDNEWAPAWVEWRYDNNYIGWAPLPPYASFRIDFGIHFSVEWRSHYSYWNFVSYPRFCNGNVITFLEPAHRVERFFGRTKYRTNYYSRDREIYNGGINRNIIERRGKVRISEVSLRNADYNDRIDRSREKEVFVYRPKAENNRVDINEISRGERKLNIEREKVFTERKESERKNTREIEKRNPEAERKYDGSDSRSRQIVPDETNARKPAVKNERKIESRANERPDSRTEPEKKRIERNESVIKERTREPNSVNVKPRETRNNESRKVEKVR